MNKIDIVNYLNTNGVCRSPYELVESAPSATLKKVYVCNIPKDTVVLRMDNIKVFNFIAESMKLGYNKHCDYALITDTHVVFVELKSQKNLNDKLKEECIKKFSADLCVLDYADAVFRIMASKNSYFDKMEKRYVLLYQALPIPKISITNQNQQITTNDNPNNFRSLKVVNESRLDFDDFL